MLMGTYTVGMRYQREGFPSEARFLTLSGLNLMRSLISQLCLYVTLFLPVLCFMEVPANAAGLTPQEKKTVQSVNANVLRAGKSYAADEYEASAEYIRAAIKQIGEAVDGGSPRLYDELVPAMQRIEKARTLLDLEGCH